jgi:hypothetical protein
MSHGASRVIKPHNMTLVTEVSFNLQPKSRARAISSVL